MRLVWKYPVPLGISEISLPAGYKIVHADTQDGSPVLWIEVCPDNPVGQVLVGVIGTGTDIPDGVEHVGTFLAGPYVWHVYV